MKNKSLISAPATSSCRPGYAVAATQADDLKSDIQERLRPARRCNRSSAFLAAAIAFLSWQMPAKAEGESEFLIFLSGDQIERTSVDLASIATSDFTPAADTLFSYTNGSWRIVGEYFLTDDENELERLQIGYDFSNDTTLWFGRFHQPISAWNHRYHHGAYLQPSISRPAIENWEDESGVIPAHSTGFLLDTWQPMGDQNGLRYVVSAGIAPVLGVSELMPFDVLDPDDSSHKPAASLSISYFPDYVDESNFGLIAGYSEIEALPVPALGIDSNFAITQTLIGAQVVWERNDWQLISASYYVDNEVKGTPVDVGGWFLAGYAQALRTLSQNTNAYVRIERTSNAGTSGYLRLFPGYVYQRDVAGFRYDFSEHQAIALEYSGDKTFGDEYEEIRVQWSAVFP